MKNLSAYALLFSTVANDQAPARIGAGVKNQGGEWEYEKADLILRHLQMRRMQMLERSSRLMTSVRWLTTGLYSPMLEANPFDLGESFWEQRSSARNLALFVDREDLGRPPGPLTFGFTLDGYAALARHLPCLPNAKLRKDGRIKIRVQV